MPEAIPPVGRLAGLCGHDGTNWQKLNLLFGYYDRLAASKSTTTATAGTNVLNMDAVPAGEVWVVQAASMKDVNNATTGVELRAIVAGNEVVLNYTAAVAAGVPVPWTGQATLKAGDYLQGVWLGVTLNDDLYLIANGYKMKVA